ncbi:MAG: peptide-N(4)-(N-acetyl-beta-glucosaminyl)asparagine amidase [Acidobacteriaceae bacterium]|nr:peptide-N(4)-(N-acetyl-beta-glucosaminyl)asparagine amidase [Acidobacteriaceae bacterium]
MKSGSISSKLFFAVALLLTFILEISVVPGFAASRYKIGSSNTVTADRLVPRPSTTPCVVQLFQNVAFDDFNPRSFSYTPPADCPGPWQKVVFEGDFSVTAGRQYDRTANIWLGATNIYFGTTAEPRRTLSPSWHVETDLTDYSAVFTSPQSGQADIGNLVNQTYTGIIYGTATLEFYPLSANQKAPRTFDAVLALSAGPNGGTVGLGSSSDTLSQTLSLPMNIDEAYLDVLAQSQSNDEFWYTCVPNDVASELQSCGNTAFRETEVSIDGTPAGVAPVYPWIYTGGIDPYLWFPLAGVQTLNFVPYRVNLTPFAGLLSDGQPHTVSLSVFNADNYFSATANLLLLLDHNADQVTGGLTANTLSANPNPIVAEHLKNNAKGVNGTVSVTSQRSFAITGYVVTGTGRVETTVEQAIGFLNSQKFNITNTAYVQNIKQSTIINSWTTQTSNAGINLTYDQQTYPLSVLYSYKVNPDGTSAQLATISQEYSDQNTVQRNGKTLSSTIIDDKVAPTDTLNFDASGNFTGNTGQASSQDFLFKNLLGCYDVTLTAASNVLTGVLKGCQ